MRFVGARLKQARMARGYTARALAEEVELSPSIVSGYEQSKKVPSPDTIETFARFLDVPARIFYKPMPETGCVHDVFYRSVSAVTKGLRDTLNQRATWICEVFDFLEGYFDFSEVNLPNRSSADVCRGRRLAEDAADTIRQFWKLGNDPIDNLAHLMEENGVTISKISFGSDKMDGFSFWHRDNFPMVVIASDKGSRSRTRFDLSHELGHLALGHKRAEDPDPEVVKAQETEANQFASAFLLPQDSISVDLDEALEESNRRGVLNCLWPLKLKWKVSFASLLYRAHELGKINDQQYQSGYVMLSQRGWRKVEPLEEDLPEECPETLRWCIEKLVGDGDFTTRQLIEALSLPPRDVADICGLPENFFEEKQDSRLALRVRRRD